MALEFKDLNIGEEFTAYGDDMGIYNYPKVCHCKKISVDRSLETDDGFPFYVDQTLNVQRCTED